MCGKFVRIILLYAIEEHDSVSRVGRYNTISKMALSLARRLERETDIMNNQRDGFLVVVLIVIVFKMNSSR